MTAFPFPMNAETNTQTPLHDVTLTGRVSCGRCQALEPQHKGYTRWTWAVHSVSEGDDIVFVVRNDIYKLRGDKDQLLKFMEDKATVSGEVDGHTLTVQTISRPDKQPIASKGKPSNTY